MTRAPINVLFLVAAALLGETQSSNAQSPYSYSWCSLGGAMVNSNARSCYYTSWQQCMATTSGIGGHCIRNPYYNAQPAELPHRALAKPRHQRHARTARVSTAERLE
jgi:hypothetical protein